jgi:hypothetical protein
MEKPGSPASISGKLIINPTVVGVMKPTGVEVMQPTGVGVMEPTGVEVMEPTGVGAMNPTVRKAIDALQRGEARAWLSLFVKNAVLYDHGNAMTAGEFIEKSVGREYFTRIDRTDDIGLSVVGSYHTIQWGDFLVSFQFSVTGRRISRLDVSQVAY